MARHRRTRAEQLHILRSRRPGSLTPAFNPALARGASIAVTISKVISKAISQALKGCGLPNGQVAHAMGGHLDEEVGGQMLKSCASAAKHGHIISALRFLAPIHVTRDRRLLERLAEPFGRAVIAHQHLPALERAAITGRKAELEREAGAVGANSGQQGG